MNFVPKTFEETAAALERNLHEVQMTKKLASQVYEHPKEINYREEPEAEQLPAEKVFFFSATLIEKIPHLQPHGWGVAASQLSNMGLNPDAAVFVRGEQAAPMDPLWDEHRQAYYHEECEGDTLFFFPEETLENIPGLQSFPNGVPGARLSKMGLNPLAREFVPRAADIFFFSAELVEKVPCLPQDGTGVSGAQLSKLGLNPTAIEFIPGR